MANLTAQTRLTGRAFGRWWWRDLRKAWLSLTAATILIELAGLALLAGAVLIIPNLQAGLSSGSLSSLVRLFIAVGGHLYETGGLVLLAAVLIISWLGLSAAILISRLESNGSGQSWRRLVRHYGRLLGAGLVAGFVLIGLSVAGFGLAYGASRWYFGAVIPIGAVTFIIVALFSVWLAFFPFTVLWDDRPILLSLSASRRCAALVFGRLIGLCLGFGLLGAYATFWLARLSLWLAAGVPLVLIPIFLSLLGSLYAEARAKA